ncbi:hypothetical protein [Streptomyces torulosus]|uniref:nSTAND1 domain-containing NTPase n=1 Tax=Streptomyces torulosus TaxID=68276 RepID=UPI003B838CF7
MELWFEPGLPERCAAGVDNEPDPMQLVQFASTKLGKRRIRSILTHAAHDSLGGVAGALVTCGDDALAGLRRAQQEWAKVRTPRSRTMPHRRGREGGRWLSPGRAGPCVDLDRTPPSR